MEGEYCRIAHGASICQEFFSNFLNIFLMRWVYYIICKKQLFDHRAVMKATVRETTMIFDFFVSVHFSLVASLYIMEVQNCETY